ncbi:MAG: hypothetical protein JRJ85_24505, partial [Deltaproteobacteria bacterium]|nr:hypothetical protein [Deltaproteobacteria bacterium]
MKKMTLKNKLLAGSVAMVVLVMAASAIVVSVVINRQNRTASFQNIERSLNIIREDLSGIQDKLLADTRQMAGINEMGSTLKFVQQFKDNKVMIVNPLRKMTMGIGQVGMTGNLWKTAIYGSEGELIAFSDHRAGGELLLGSVYDTAKGVVSAATLKEGKKIEHKDWKDMAQFQDPKIKLKFRGEIPKKETVIFEDIKNTICIVSLVPITAEEYTADSDKAAIKQVGFAMGVRRLEKSFVEKMSRTTSMKINFFVKKGLSLGDIRDYTTLQTDEIKKSKEKWTLKKGRLLLNEIGLKAGNYFQGVLPLYGASRFVGAIAALQSTDIVKSNTWQMIQLLGLVYLACVLVIVPCAVIFSNSLSKPINKIIKILTETSQKVSAASAQVSISSNQL